jgi:hypothetical protein
MDTPASNCQFNPSCTDFNVYYQGEMLKTAKAKGKIPVFYAYVIAFEARNLWGLQDCNVGSPNLCQKGAEFIRQKTDRILERYDHHSKNIANIIGSSATVVFLIEPDFWQYYGDKNQQGGGISGPQMRSLFDGMVSKIKANLPNALISWDISAWIGQDGFRTWWGFFSSSNQINFVHTSGGEAQGGSSQLRPNELSWSFVSSVTGKKIIADSGYGVGGGANGEIIFILKY